MTQTGDLLVIVPSRGRPQNIRRLLNAVHNTAMMNTHVSIGIDDDDDAASNYMKIFEECGREWDDLQEGCRKGLTEWTNHIAVPEAANYPYLASFGDDMIPRTKGWDKALITGIERMGGTGFTYPHDGSREDIPEAVVMSSDIVQVLGWMAEPSLNHFYIDNVWADLGRGAGCIRHLRAVFIEHAQQGDKTSRDSGEKLAADRDAYYEWRKDRMADDLSKVMSLKRVLQPA